MIPLFHLPPADNDLAWLVTRYLDLEAKRKAAFIGLQLEIALSSTPRAYWSHVYIHNDVVACSWPGEVDRQWLENGVQTGT